jgi:Contractile injection system spike tip protein
MPELVLKTGDLAIFDPEFDGANVIAPPGILVGTGLTSVMLTPACVEGDQEMVMVPCVYLADGFETPGAGMCLIDALNPDQIAETSSSDELPLLLQGSTFQALMQVLVPCTQIDGPVVIPDPVPEYPGEGFFITTNLVVTAT